MFVFIYLALHIICVYGKNELYMGYQVYNVKFETEAQQENLFLLKSDIVEFWRNPSLKNNVTGRVMIPPSHVPWFEETLEKMNLKKDVYIEDVYRYLNERESRQYSDDSEETIRFDFNTYHRYETILENMRELKVQYENSTRVDISLVETAVTDERRPIAYLEISNLNGLQEKPVVIIEAGMIPRDWITVPSALNIVQELLNNTQNEYINNIHWIIIPVLNPDGYEYTHTNLRLWMKSRSTRSNLGIICPGVNINRNFAIDWRFSDTSTSPCSHIFGGDEEFSEPESRLIQSLIRRYSRRIRLYISLQNNGGFVSYPWQYEKAASGMFRQHHLVGLEMIAELGEEYNLNIGSLALGDRASGTSTDYARDNGVLYTFNLDIAGSGDNGVLIPESEIRSIVKKVWRAVAVAVSSVMN